MMENDVYYRQRIEEELNAAKSANDPGIAQIHREMAQRYRDKVNGEAPPVELRDSLAKPGRLPA